MAANMMIMAGSVTELMITEITGGAGAKMATTKANAPRAWTHWPGPLVTAKKAKKEPRKRASGTANTGMRRKRPSTSA